MWNTAFHDPNMQKFNSDILINRQMKGKLTMAKIVKEQEVAVEDSALQEVSSNDNEVVV